MDTTRMTAATAEAYRLERTGALDLAFRGWQLGAGESGSGGTSGYRCDWNRGVKVRVCLTVTGRLVTSRVYWSQWQGERGRSQAEVHDTPKEALDWLHDDDGQLKPAEQEAWEAACEAHPELKGLDVETV